MFARMDIVDGASVGVFLTRPELVKATDEEIAAGIFLDARRTTEIMLELRKAACLLTQRPHEGSC